MMVRPLYQQSMPKGEQSNDKVRKLQILVAPLVYANRLQAREKNTANQRQLNLSSNDFFQFVFEISE